MKIRLFGLPVAVLFLFALSFQTSSPAADFPAVNQAELKITSLPEQPGASAFVLFHEEIDNDLLHFHQVYMRIKVLTEAGREYANVELPYNNRYVDVADIRGRTIHADGTIIPFEGKPFEKVIAKGQDFKYKVKAFTMPDVQIGSIIEYRYSVRYSDDRVIPPRWVLQNDMFQRELHFVFVPYKRDVMLAHGRVGNGLAWTWNTPKNEQPQTWADGRIEIKLKNVAAFNEEEYLPPPTLLKYYVYFYYSTARSTQQFWNEEGKYWSKEVDHFAEPSDALRSALAGIIAPTDTPEQKVRKIYAFVSKLENTTYIPARTTEERTALGLTPNKLAGDVIRQKSGDRDEITRTFIALARLAGIPAYAFRVTARDSSYFVEPVMDFDQLDDEIAVVQLDGQDVYLDPGTRFCPYGIVYWKYTAAKGLRQLSDARAQLAETAPLSYKDSQTRRALNLRLGNDGNATGTLTVTYDGQEAIRHRLRAIRTDASGRTKDIEDEAKGWLPANAEVTLTGQPLWESDAPLVINYKVNTSLLTSAGKRLMMPANVLAFNQRERFPHPQRKNMVYFNYSYVEVDDVRIDLPDSLLLEAVSTPIPVKLDWAYYGFTIQQGGRRIAINRQLLMGGSVFPVELYKDLKSFYDQAHAGDQMQLLFKSKVETSAPGN